MNGILIVDKQQDWTSHDVVAKLRGLLGEKRIGHGGTLDPMATGVLPVFIGRATRAAAFFTDKEKAYTARLRLGLTTDTQDIWGRTLREAPAAGREALEAALPMFRGRLLQLPPMYSAVKIGGRKLYELARRGEEVERQPREIFVRALELDGEAEGDFILKIVCSSGTYVRTICHDIGQALGCGAAMSALRRTRAGMFTEAGALTLERIGEAVRDGAIDGLVRPVDALFSEYPAFTAGAEQERRCRCGAEFPAGVPDGIYRVYGGDGAFLMLGCASGGRMTVLRSFFEV